MKKQIEYIEEISTPLLGERCTLRLSNGTTVQTSRTIAISDNVIETINSVYIKRKAGASVDGNSGKLYGISGEQNKIDNKNLPPIYDKNNIPMPVQPPKKPQEPPKREPVSDSDTTYLQQPEFSNIQQNEQFIQQQLNAVNTPPVQPTIPSPVQPTVQTQIPKPIQPTEQPTIPQTVQPQQTISQPVQPTAKPNVEPQHELTLEEIEREKRERATAKREEMEDIVARRIERAKNLKIISDVPSSKPGT